MKTIYSTRKLLNAYVNMPEVGKAIIGLSDFIESEKNMSWKLKYISSPSFSLLLPKYDVLWGDSAELSTRVSGKTTGTYGDINYLTDDDFNKNQISELRKIRDLSIKELGDLLTKNPRVLPDFVIIEDELDRNNKGNYFVPKYGLVSYRNRIEGLIANESENKEINFYISPEGLPKKEYSLTYSMVKCCGQPWLVNPDGVNLKVKAKIKAKGLNEEELKEIQRYCHKYR